MWANGSIEILDVYFLSTTCITLSDQDVQISISGKSLSSASKNNGEISVASAG